MLLSIQWKLDIMSPLDAIFPHKKKTASELYTPAST
jgi:hypothetical protein